MLPPDNFDPTLLVTGRTYYHPNRIFYFHPNQP
jgi:hypothetical protein